MWRGLGALLGALACAGAALGHPHGRARAADAQDALVAPKVVRVRDKPDEPTCDQLKAMWRFSKRQARAPEIINDITSYRDPFTYNEWPAYPAQQMQAVPRYRGAYNYRNNNFAGPYGRVIHKAPAGPSRVANYDEVARLYGVLSDSSSTDKFLRNGQRTAVHLVPPPQQGRFQHLKDLIRTERARELQAQRAAEQLAARAAVLKDIAAGGRPLGRHGNPFNEQEERQIQELEYPVSDDPQPLRAMFSGGQPRQQQRPTNGFQFSRYSHEKDMVPPPDRRSAPLPYVPLYDYQYPDSLADLMAAYYY